MSSRRITIPVCQPWPTTWTVTDASPDLGGYSSRTGPRQAAASSTATGTTSATTSPRPNHLNGCTGAEGLPFYPVHAGLSRPATLVERAPCPPPANRQGAGSISTSRCHSWTSTTLCPSRTVAMISARAVADLEGRALAHRDLDRILGQAAAALAPGLPAAVHVVLGEGHLDRDRVIDRAVDDGGEQDAVAVGGEVRGRIDVRPERGHFHRRAPIGRRAITELTICVRAPAEDRPIHAHRARIAGRPPRRPRRSSAR